MGVIRLGVCIGGVYAAFLLWAIAQERLSAPFPSTSSSSSPPDSSSSRTYPKGDHFPSPLFLNYAQALASCLSAFTYLTFNAWRSGDLAKNGWRGVLGFDNLAEGWKGPSRRVGGGERRGSSSSSSSSTPSPGGSQAGRLRGHTSSSSVSVSPLLGAGAVRRGSAQVEKGQLPAQPVPPIPEKSEVNGNGTIVEEKGSSLEIPTLPTKVAPVISRGRSLPALLLQVSTFQTIAGPIGFLALRHISFPTMVLGKSCKLIPVMLLNVLLYRRRFSAHKYVVVALVTAGISIFMLLAPKKAGKGGGSDSIWGLSLLIFNLMIDGLTNATQDQIFALYPHYTGQQMMFHMSLLAQIILLPLMLLPLPASPLVLLSHIPLISTLFPTLPPADLTLAPPAFLTSTSFLLSHPTALPPLLAYALLGGLGQLFIFETIQHFGSLTLTMVTVTRKLFTMLLSVIVFEHQLTGGQWVGVGVVFAGIGVEAGVKRREVMRKARRD